MIAPPNMPLKKPDEPQRPDGVGPYARALVARLDLELELLAAVFAVPGAGVAVALEAGITDESFHHQDLQIIWVSLRQGHREDMGKGDILNLAAKALAICNFWDSTQIPANLHSCLWSARKLLMFASAWTSNGIDFHCPAKIKDFAHQLLNIGGFLRDAAEYDKGRRMALSACVVRRRMVTCGY
jgi:hypothetical protein